MTRFRTILPGVVLLSLMLLLTMPSLAEDLVPVWQHEVEHPDQYNRFASITPFSDDQVIAVGSAQPDSIVPLHYPMLRRLTLNGLVLQSFVDTENPGVWTCVQELHDGTVFLGGYREELSDDTLYYTGILRLLDPNGVELWTTELDPHSPTLRHSPDDAFLMTQPPFAGQLLVPVSTRIRIDDGIGEEWALEFSFHRLTPDGEIAFTFDRYGGYVALSSNDELYEIRRLQEQMEPEQRWFRRFDPADGTVLWTDFQHDPIDAPIGLFTQLDGDVFVVTRNTLETWDLGGTMLESVPFDGFPFRGGTALLGNTWIVGGQPALNTTYTMALADRDGTIHDDGDGEDIPGMIIDLATVGSDRVVVAGSYYPIAGQSIGTVAMWAFGSDAGDAEQGAAIRPAGFTLRPVVPNPFNHAATVAVELPHASPLRVSVFDLLGRPVSLLHDGPAVAGTNRLVWRPDGIASGQYIVRAETEDERQMRRMLFLK